MGGLIRHIQFRGGLLFSFLLCRYMKNYMQNYSKAAGRRLISVVCGAFPMLIRIMQELNVDLSDKGVWDRRLCR